MAVIFYLSSLTEPPLPPSISDKQGHSFGYTGLGVAVLRAVAGGLPARVRWRTALVAIAITVAYGASDEFHQLFVSGRSADLHDLAADASGAVLAAVLCWAWGILAIRSDV
jgi:VanZ family protein